MRVNDSLMSKTLSILRSLDFQAFISVGKKSSFDILAKKDNRLILIKVLLNIDGLKETQAKSLKCIANRLNASALIVGEKTKTFKMEDGVVYERYGVYAITPGTLESALKGELPTRRFWKGRMVVKLDQEKFSEIVSEEDVEKVAEVLGVSKKAVYMYTKGMRLDAKRAKQFMDKYDVSPVGFDIFSPPEAEDIPVTGYLKDLERLGFEVIPAYSGFDAIAKEKEKLVVAKKNMVTETTTDYLKKAGEFLNGHPLLISNRKETAINNIPVINEDEIKSAKRSKDIIKLVKEREKE